VHSSIDVLGPTLSKGAGGSGQVEGDHTDDGEPGNRVRAKGC